MIAPEGEVKAACCHGESAEAGERQPRYPGRGAASGLVRGLRGQPPFDGAQLPRLPWGGAVVAEEETAFISDWIDDGCPADDREIASFALSGRQKGTTPRTAPLAARERAHALAFARGNPHPGRARRARASSRGRAVQRSFHPRGAMQAMSLCLAFQARNANDTSADHADAPPPSAPARINWARNPPGAVLNGERRPEVRKPGRAFVNGPPGWIILSV